MRTLLLASLALSFGCHTAPAIVKAFDRDFGVCVHEMTVEGFGSKDSLSGTLSEGRDVDKLRGSSRGGGGTVGLTMDLTRKSCK